MTTFGRIPTVLLNPMFLALLTSGWGLGAGSNTAPTLRPQETPAQLAVPETPVTVPRASIPQWLKQAPAEPLSSVQQALAERFARALGSPHNTSSRSRVTRSPTKTAATSAPKRLWVCGQWEDLVQGRGQGRTCEWR